MVYKSLNVNKALHFYHQDTSKQTWGQFKHRIGIDDQFQLIILKQMELRNYELELKFNFFLIGIEVSYKKIKSKN